MDIKTEMLQPFVTVYVLAPRGRRKRSKKSFRRRRHGDAEQPTQPVAQQVDFQQYFCFVLFSVLSSL